MSKTFTYIYLFLTCYGVQAQVQYKSLYTLEQAIEKCDSDKLQNSYVAMANGIVQKYTPRGKLAFEYSNNTLGEIGVLNATDPFNITLFYPDYLSVIFLDRTLNETQRIGLLDAYIFEAQTIGVSTENQIWVYDSYDFRLKKINQQATITYRSDDLSLLLQKSIHPTQIQEYENKVYVNTSESGILVFDSFANYLTRLDFKEVEYFQVIQNQLLFLEDDSLHSYHLQSKLTSPVALPLEVKKIKQFQIQKNRLYLHTDAGLQVYSFE